MEDTKIDWLWGAFFSETRNSVLVSNDVMAVNRLMGELKETTGSKVRVLCREDLVRIVNQRDFKMAVVRDKDKDPFEEPSIVGMGSIHWKETPAGLCAYVDDVVVNKAYRGKGLATKIMNELIETAKTVGADAVYLTSNPKRVEANHLYQKLGFKRINEETNMYELELSKEGR